MADTYANYAALAAVEVEGVDYTVTTFDGGGRVLLKAIHGGSIEGGSSELATAIALMGTGHRKLYLFNGIKSSGNNNLHITSTNFDEPRAEALVAQSDWIISIHGYSNDEEYTYVGGLDIELRTYITRALQAADFVTQRAPSTVIGEDPANISNRGRRMKGVQLELTRGLRDSLFVGGVSPAVNRLNKTPTFNRYANAVNEGLVTYLRAQPGTIEMRQGS